MPGLWIKVDADFHLDELMMRAGPMAQVLHIRAMGFCRKMLTDGKITKGQVAALTYDMPESAEQIERLEFCEDGKSPLWEPINGGWMLESYGDLNQSAAEIADITEKKRKAGKARADKAAAQQSAQQPVEHLLSTCLAPEEHCAEAVSEHRCSTLLCSEVGSTNNGTDVHLPQAKPDGAEWEPDDPAYTPIAGYDGKSELALWEKTWGKISPSQVTMAQNSLIRLHVYFKLSVQQVRRLVEHVNTDPEAGEWWGGKQRSPSSWLQQDESGQHRWQKIRTHAESSTKPKPPKGDGDVRPTPTPFSEILNQ